MQAIELVNLDTTQTITAEARRQLEICNACRYCERYCSVFPAVHRERAFTDNTIIQLSNLCHNCRGCYYACQYTAPHEFNLNLPKALADVRQQSWQDMAYPQFLSRAFHTNGTAIALAVVAGFFLFMRLLSGKPDDASIGGFYALLSHNAMVALFLPAFVLPIVAIGTGLLRYWKTIGGQPVSLAHIKTALASAATMKNLAGGHKEGCNFEDEDRFSHARRYAHHATMYGFLLCFAATSTATIMHYFLGMPAPYGLFSLPKVLGLSGGLSLSLGTASLAWLKLRADKNLGSRSAWGGEMAFIVLLFLVSTTGLLLYALADTSALPTLLALHLGSVLALFVTMPFSKMVHGFYRLASLIKDAQHP